jgi:hypothetical protein
MFDLYEQRETPSSYLGMSNLLRDFSHILHQKMGCELYRTASKHANTF